MKMMISLDEKELLKALEEVAEMVKEYTDTQPISFCEDEEELDYVRKSFKKSINRAKTLKGCECGAEKCNISIHSDYCPKYNK